MRKIVITAALTGGLPVGSMSSYIPITPQQIVDEAVRAYNAGAAIAHIHVRDPETGEPVTSGNREKYLGLFHEVLTKIKSQCDIICCPSTGGQADYSIESRISVVPAFKPELCSFSCGSMTSRPFRKAFKNVEEKQHAWEKDAIQKADNAIFVNSMAMLKELSKACAENDTKPEMEIYDVGMIENVDYLIKEGYIKTPVYIQFVMGFAGGIPSKPKNLLFLYETARETIQEFVWSALGTGRRQMLMCTQALLLGSNCVRVGLEDSLVHPDGSLAKSSAEQVERIIKIARGLGLESSTPDEARQILGLKGLDKVNW